MFDKPFYDILISFAYLLGALIYCVFLQVLSRFEYHYKITNKPLSDEACLEKMSRIYGISEYMVFLAAATQWHISEKQTQSAFKNYLRRGDMPYYVRDFLRQHKHEIEKSGYFIFPFKNHQPPPGSA